MADAAWRTGRRRRLAALTASAVAGAAAIVAAVLLLPLAGRTIILTRAETGPFAALIRKVSGLPSPRDQVAIIIDGRVIADPAVQGAIPGGNAQISGFATRAQAEASFRPC